MHDDRAPDTVVRYRTDGLGQRVALIPATCKLGVHALGRSGYRAKGYPSEGVVRVSCDACREAIEVDHFWVLTTSGADPARVEFDDEPYRDVVPVMIAPHAEHGTGPRTESQSVRRDDSRP